MRNARLRLAAVLIALLSPAVAYTDVHFALRRSAPAADEILDASPKKLQVWFSQVPAAGVSQLGLMTAEEKPIDVPKSSIDKESMSISVEIKDPLAAGAYIMAWRGAGDDGHVLSGQIKFTIARKAVR
jgi:methionine-rich copper-binding protein CopC